MPHFALLRNTSRSRFSIILWQGDRVNSWVQSTKACVKLLLMECKNDDLAEKTMLPQVKVISLKCELRKSSDGPLRRVDARLTSIEWHYYYMRH